MRLAGQARKRVLQADPFARAAFVVGLVASGGGYEIVVENREDLDPEMAGELLRLAADKLQGKDDRAAGAWGR
jgi:hypothetical protein